MVSMKVKNMTHLKTAPVDMFITLRPRVLRGKMLAEIKSVQASIERFGLLSPITVTRHDGKLVVVDGRKRLIAMRRLEFAGRLPRSLVNIPFVEVSDIKSAKSPVPALMSHRELYETVVTFFREHNSVEAIAEALYLSHKDVRAVLTLSHLSPRLRRAFFDRTIDFDQARCYAAMPQVAMQDRVFMALGPFATGQDIIDHIRQPKLAPAAQLRLAA